MKKTISLICVVAMLTASLALFPVFAEDAADSMPMMVGYQYSDVYQNNDGAQVRNLRFIAAGNSLEYQKVGFTITTGVGNQKWDKASTQVYKSIQAKEPDGTVTEILASEFSATYLFIYVIEGIPVDVTADFKVQPYAIAQDDSKAEGKESSLTLAKSEQKVTLKYSVPADVAIFEVDGENYKVIRNFGELKETLKAPQTDGRYIFGGNIDCGGGTIEEEILKIGKGSVIEGNNCTLYNFKGFNIFDLEAGKEIVIRNLSIGSERNPIVESLPSHSAGVLAKCPALGTITKWQNCNVYANLTSDSGNDAALWIADAFGSHTFIGCNTYGFVDTANKNYSGAWFGLAAPDSYLKFENCTNYAAVNGKCAGGFIGKFQGNSKTVAFTNCINNGTVEGTGENAGGFVGYGDYSKSTKVTFDFCTNNGNVISNGMNAGGFVSKNWSLSEIRNSKNTGTIEAKDATVKSNLVDQGGAGGFIGHEALGLIIQNSINEGKVEGAVCAGGFVAGVYRGDTEISIKDSTNKGSVKGGYTGGFVGLNTTKATFTGCINQGDVTGNKEGDNVGAGGIVGYTEFSTVANTVTFTMCLNAGIVNGKAHTGGISGRSIGDGTMVFDQCANIGSIQGVKSSTNMGGYTNNKLTTIKNCYGFGYVEHSNPAPTYVGFLVCKYSGIDLTNSTGNKFYNFNTAVTPVYGANANATGLDAGSGVATLDAAVELLDAHFTTLDFEIVDGRIVLKQSSEKLTALLSAVSGDGSILDFENFI